MSTISQDYYFRKVIKITAEDSPNVRYARAQQRKGITPDDSVIVPGVLTWSKYQERLATWDPIRQCVGLRAEFYEGAEVKVYPSDWIAHGVSLHFEYVTRRPPLKRVAKSVGIDPGEGGANTCWCASDEYGIIRLDSYPTPNTDVIPGNSLAFCAEVGCNPDRMVFDRGGGGKQAADRLRAQGYPVRTVAFGESLTPNPKYGMTPVEDRIEQKEEKYVYLNRRAEMYDIFRQLMNPRAVVPGDDASNEWDDEWASIRRGIKGFAIPHGSEGVQYERLHEQMEKIPLTYDAEGRMYILPKTNKDPNSKKPTLISIIGYSPDELDSVVLSCWGLVNPPISAQVGAL